MNGLHYHGEAVRNLFIVGGVMMLVFLPVFHDFIPYPIFLSIFSVLVVGFFAGIIMPAHTWPIALNTLISAAAFAVFEYHAVAAYQNGRFWFSAVNQVLAVVFFAAFYLGIRSAKGVWLQKEASKASSSSFALDTLKTRYAKGEIGTKEFEERRKELEE